MLRRTREPGCACYLCGSSARGIAFREGAWSVVKCPRCSLLQTWPQPDEATLASIYDAPAYFDTREMTRAAADGGVARARTILADLRPGTSRLLDFGAGTGHLIHGLREIGIAADGVEPTDTARGTARDLYGLELHATVEQLGERYYDAITLVHVLEHLRDPVAELQRLSSALVPGGELFIEVPHAGAARLLPASQRRLVLDLPVHLFHFTPTTLTAVLERAGFTPTVIRLFNPWFVERALARRGRPEPAAGSDTPAASGSADHRGGSPVGVRTWRKALPLIRRAFPGDKFQVVARDAR